MRNSCTTDKHHTIKRKDSLFCILPLQHFKMYKQDDVACGTAATMNAGAALSKKEDADFLYAGLSHNQHHHSN
jgi:hypothetical protein